MPALELIYGKLNSDTFYKEAVKKRIAKIILGASVIRAFTKNTKPGLINCLMKLDVDSLLQINSVKEHDVWHTEKITSVYNCLLKTNAVKFKNHHEGLKWGHASKIFNLFIGHLCFYSPYFESGKRKSYIKFFNIYSHTG